jgi:hypothetical protein
MAETFFLARHQEAGEVFGQVSSLRFARKEIGEVRQRLAHDLWNRDNCGHGHFLRKQSAPSKTTVIKEEKNHFFHAA